LRRGRSPFILGVLFACTVLLVLVGCTTNHYRKAADKEVYKIIREAEQNVFGRTNIFSIATEYSDRDPESISPEEIIEERNQGGERVLTIEDSLQLAVTSSRRYQTERERLYLTALSLTGERYAFSPQFF